MPTYEYMCNACEHEWEEFQAMSAKPTKKCPECGKRKAERLISGGGGLIFKGSGFYCTDYRSKSYNEDKKQDTSSSKSESSESSTASSNDKKSTASDKKKTEPASKSNSSAE